MNLSEVTNQLKVGFMYKADSGSGDYSGLWLGIVGFRKNQVKVLDLSSGSPDVDNVDIMGKFAVKFDLSSARKPNDEEQKGFDEVHAIQAKLPKEEK